LSDNSRLQVLGACKVLRNPACVTLLFRSAAPQAPLSAAVRNLVGKEDTMLYAPKERGQGLVEYALILVLVAVVVIVILALLGPAIGNVFSNIVSQI
jgi:pilus assembly protein Flp/PilA